MNTIMDCEGPLDFAKQVFSLPLHSESLPCVTFAYLKIPLEIDDVIVYLIKQMQACL